MVKTHVIEIGDVIQFSTTDYNAVTGVVQCVYFDTNGYMVAIKTKGDNALRLSAPL